MKRKKLTIISILVMVAVLLFVVFVGIPRFHDKISRGSYLRGTILSLAKVAVLIRDRFLGHTIVDKLAQLHSTKSCQFCNLIQANMNGIDLKGLDLSYANLTGADLSGADLSGANLLGANLRVKDLNNVNVWKELMLERDSTAVTSVTTDPQTGTYYLKVANTAGNTRPCAYITPTLVVGNIYKVTGWIQGVTAGGSNGSTGWININYAGQEDRHVGHTLTADTWVKFEMEFKALETSPEIWFTTAGNEGDGDYIYVDNVSIYEILQPEDQAAKRMWLQYLL